MSSYEERDLSVSGEAADNASMDIPDANPVSDDVQGTGDQAEPQVEIASSKTGQASGNHDVGGLRIRILNALMIVLVCFVAIMFLQAVRQTNETYNAFSEETESYIECEIAANDMKEGSNYLTAQIRQFVITHDVEYLDRYFIEADETQRRDKAVAILDKYVADKPAHMYLMKSRERSEELMDVEYHAAKLVLAATGEKPNKGADVLNAVVLSKQDQALSDTEKFEKAMGLVFGGEYQAAVDDIEGNVAKCKTALIDDIEAEQIANAKALDWLLVIQQVLTWALLAVAVLMIISIFFFILLPIREYIARIGENKSLPMKGAHELRIMADEYNNLYEENLKHNDALRRKAEHDHLTGLYNREVFDRLLHAYRDENVALLLIDADYFKEVNDTHGHDVGDKVLKKIASVLQHTFRSTDYPCRIGGDEFAVIMTDVTPDLANVISGKVEQMAKAMADTSDGSPAMTMSVGVAFGEAGLDYEAIYKRADEALYKVKEAGRNGHGFYQG